MKDRGNRNSIITNVLIFLLILLPISLFILYLLIDQNSEIEPGGESNGDEQTIKMNFEEIGHFDLEGISGIEISNGIGWISTRTGLYRYDPRTENIQNFNESHGMVDQYLSCIAVDDEIVCVGSWNGVSIYNISEKKWRNFTNETLLGYDWYWVSDIIIEDDYIWVASEGKWQYTMGLLPFGGISCYDRNADTWTVYNSSNGYLIDDNVNAIDKDGNNIWMATLSGTYIFNIRDKTLYIWDDDTLAWREKRDNDRLQNLYHSHTKYAENIIVKQDKTIIWYYSDIVEIYSVRLNNWTILKRIDWVMDIEKNNEYVYFGSKDGVEILNMTNLNWTSFNESSGLINIVAHEIGLINDQLWIASEEGVTIYQISYETIPKNNRINQNSR